MRKRTVIFLLSLWAVILGCTKDPHFDDIGKESGSNGGHASVETRGTRTVTPESRRVLILYSAGYNSLMGWLRDDIEDFVSGYVPGGTRDDDVLLILSRLTKRAGDYVNPVPPVLERVYKDDRLAVVRDTLKVWDPYAPVTSASFMSEALTLIAEKFPAAGYGMIFSSHGSGWVPPQYYDKPNAVDPDYNDDTGFWAPGKRKLAEEFPPINYTWPQVKSLGQDKAAGGVADSYSEMAMEDLKTAFPIHLDYLLVDACLMGCIEFAYEMRHICDKIAFSQAEVLADGFQYTTVVSRLLEGPEPDLVGACQDYFNCYYNKPSLTERSATISLVDCTKLDALADVCADLFAAHQTELRGINPHAVQRYFRFNRHFFYDLQDILLHCNLTSEESARLEEALASCIIYKAATPSFIVTMAYGFYINVFSGFSMYLPADGTPYLDNYYKENISWNRRTGLVQ
jgi:hypothetical protein